MQRRHFLKLLGLASGTAILGEAAANAGTAQAASGSRIAPNPAAVGVLHDSGLCIGCRRCEEACARVNDRPPPPEPFSDLSVLDRKRRPSVAGYTVVNKYMPENVSKPVFRKQQCNHCLEPACASACFVKAFIKNPDGSVTYNPRLCVGCRYCMIACPFNVPAYDYHNVLNPLVHKCTLCAPRLVQGKEPACVESCPTGALLFAKRHDLLLLARNRIAREAGRYVDHIYGEREMGGTSWLYISPVPHADLGQPGLAAASAPELTAGALASVPMVAGLWPVLLTGAYAISNRKEKIAREEQDAAVGQALAEARDKADADLKTALAKAAKQQEAVLAAEVAKARKEAAAEAEEQLRALMPEAKPSDESEKPSHGEKTPQPAKNAQKSGEDVP